MCEHRGFSIYRVVGSLLTLAFIAVVIVLGGAPGIFFNIPSFLFVVGITVALLIAVHGRTFSPFSRDAFLAFFLQEVPPNPRYAAVARDGSRFAVASGAVGSLIGVIQMLVTLDDPSKIGGGIAVALLTALYGLILSEFIFGPIATVYGTPPGGEGTTPTLTANNLGIPMAVAGLITFSFLMLVLAFSVMERDRMTRHGAIILAPPNAHHYPAAPPSSGRP